MDSSLARTILVFSAVLMSAACHKAGGPATAASPSAAPQGSAAASRVMSGLPAGVTARTITLGDSLFHASSCSRCHGADAKGAQNGPNLTTATHIHVNGTYDDFVRLITTGVPKDSVQDKSRRFAMQPRGGSQNPLNDEQIRAVAAYVFSLSHK
jgi:mono/diheme cytochrome c family protein